MKQVGLIFCSDETERPECSFWHPSVNAMVRMTQHREWMLIDVDFNIPNNFNAKEIEVALEQNSSMIEQQFISVVYVCLLLFLHVCLHL